MPSYKSRHGKPAQRSLTNYLLRAREMAEKSQDGAASQHASAPAHSLTASPAHSFGDGEYSLQLTKADLDESLTAMYTKNS